MFEPCDTIRLFALALHVNKQSTQVSYASVDLWKVPNHEEALNEQAQSKVRPIAPVSFEDEGESARTDDHTFYST